MLLHMMNDAGVMSGVIMRSAVTFQNARQP